MTIATIDELGAGGLTAEQVEAAVASGIADADLPNANVIEEACDAAIAGRAASFTEYAEAGAAVALAAAKPALLHRSSLDYGVAFGFTVLVPAVAGQRVRVHGWRIYASDGASWAWKDSAAVSMSPEYLGVAGQTGDAAGPGDTVIYATPVGTGFAVLTSTDMLWEVWYTQSA